MPVTVVTGNKDDRLSQLMAAALEGDAAAYEEALGAIVRVIRPYVVARVGDTLADDVVQEVLMTVHRARHTYDPTRPFGPWLTAIARSRVVDAVRRDRRRERADSASAVEQGWQPVHEPGVADVVIALDALPSHQRRVIRMLKIDGMSVREVAAALGLSASNVKVVAHRGYKELRRRLAGRADESVKDDQ